MNWQINHALKNIQQNREVSSAQHIRGDAIRIIIRDEPEVLAVISDFYDITLEQARQYHEDYPDMHFLCGCRKECTWTGDAISYLEDNQIGWGSLGTLITAISKNNIRTAAHKDFFFSYRLINQMRSATNVVREFDRVFTMTLASGKQLRVGMLKEYEPTADCVRTFWDKFGPVDILWNINPNGDPTPNAIEAGEQLGCKVMKWEDLKTLIRSR